MTTQDRQQFTTIVSMVCVLILTGTLASLSVAQDSPTREETLKGFDKSIADNANTLLRDGRRIFRFDTFGSEAFW